MMKKTTYFDFEKSQTKEKNRWLGWLSLCLMVFLGSLTSGYGQGNTCTAPLTITSLPYSHSGNTGAYGNDYTSANVPTPLPTGNPGYINGTGANSYLNGFEVVYVITPIINGEITVTTTNEDGWMALWAFKGCPFTSIIGYNTSTSGTTRSMTSMPVVANNIYYLVVSNWNAPGVNYAINVTGTAGLLTPLADCTGMPNAGTATLTPNNGNAGATIGATSTGATLASGLTYQWQKSVSGSWQNIAGATALNSSITAESGAVGTVTDYRLQVTCTASGQSAFSTTASYTVSLTYCIPTGSANNADEIRNFTLSNLNNSSAASEGLAGYKNYAGLVAPAQLQLGVPHIASLTAGTGSGTHGAAIWIDYNKNGTFETSERVSFLPNTIAASATVQFPEFMIPAATPLGTYRLRVQYHYTKSGDLLDPCAATSTFSETEDYNVEVLPTPTCLQPSGLTASNVTSSSANLSWTSNGANFELQWGPQGFALGSVTSINVTTLPYPITSGLAANTSYSYYVRQNCGATDGFSLWSGPFTFKTLCGPMPTLFENFDSYAAGTTTPMPSCWERAGNSSVYISSGSVAPNSPANRLYMSANGTAATPTEGFAIMPPFTNLQAATHRLKFKAYCSTTNKTMEIGYFTDITDLSSFVSIETIALPGTAAASTQEFSIEPTGIPAGVSSLVFRNNAPTGSTTIYIDDVSWQQLPLCPDVVVVSAQTFASTTATIIWEAGGSESTWQYVVAPATVTDPNTLTPIVSVSNNPVAMLANLTPATAYKIWIRSTCSAGLGNWPQNPFTFTTTCAAVTTFSENFDSYTAVGSANPIGNCWTRIGNTGGAYLASGSVSPLSAPNRLYLNASATGTSLNAVAVMPPVSNLQAGTHRLKFKAFATAAAKILEIGYYESAGDPTSFIVLEIFDLPSTVIANATEFYYTPQFVPAGIESLAFRNNGVANLGSTTMYIDNVVWEPLPPCFDISEVTFSNITATSVDVNWLPGGTESKWEYVYAVNTVTSPVGLTPTLVIDNPSAFIDTNLNPSTTYNFWIRSKCPDNGVGNWSTVKTFTTACGIVETFSENFDTSLTGSTNPMPLCWERAGNGSTYVTTGGALPGTPPNRLYMFASGTATVPTVGYAIMPPVSNLQANTHRLKFKAYASATAKYLEIGYFTTSGDLSTFTLLETVNLPGTTAAIAQTFTYDPSNIPTGINSLVFRNPGTPTSSTTAYIDDVTWQAKPTVIPACATNVTAVPNSQFGNYPTVITWNASPATDGYYLQMGTTSGGVDVFNNVDLGSVTSYSFTGNVATTYYYTIIPYNNIGPAVGCTQYSFTTNSTGGYCPSVPTSNDGQGVSNVMLGNQNFTSGDVMTVDHTATPVSLAQGITSNLKITLATGATYNTNVWIDLNNNFNFEENELVFQGESPSTNPTIQDASFMMPQNAPLGPHRMRIVTTDFLQTPANPCYSGTWGVRLDFTVNVTPAPSCLAPLGVSVDFASITTNTATVNWSASTTAATQGYAYYYSTSNVAPTASTTPSGTVAPGVTMVNLTGLATSSLHYFYVRAICSTTDSSAWSQAVSFTTLCDTTTLPYLIDFEAVTVPNLPICTLNENIGTGNNWITAASPGSGFTSKVLKYAYNTTNAANTWFFTNRFNLVGGTTYSVSYKYGTTSTTWTESLQVSYGLSANSAAMTTELANHPTINTVGVQLNTATFTPATSGTYVIGFRAYSITNQLNLYVDDILVQLPLATGDFNTSKFVAYPNPVKNYLTIRYNENIKDVTVFNLLGQQLFVKNINATEGQIDMSNLASGTYLLKVNSGDKMQTMKVIKE